MSANYSQEFSCSGDDNMSDATKLNKTGSLETDAVVLNDEDDSLRCKFKQVKIDDGQVQDKPVEAQSGEQNNESGTNTPVISEGERGACCLNAAGGAGEVTQYNIEAKVHAVPFDDGDNQTATATRQEPLATKPKESTSQPLLKPTSQEPLEEDDEHYDILLLYSEHDTIKAQKFFDIAKNANWKVATSDDFLVTQTKLKSFEDVYKNSSYTVLLLTANFMADGWCDHRYQTAYTDSIENSKNECTVIPVICEAGFNMPFALRKLNEVYLEKPYFARRMQKAIKIERRLHRENAEKEKQT